MTCWPDRTSAGSTYPHHLRHRHRHRALRPSCRTSPGRRQRAGPSRYNATSAPGRPGAAEVSPRLPVGNVKNNDPGLVRPIAVVESDFDPKAEVVGGREDRPFLPHFGRCPIPSHRSAQGWRAAIYALQVYGDVRPPRLGCNLPIGVRLKVLNSTRTFALGGSQSWTIAT
jgi:hypothetical protein